MKWPPILSRGIDMYQGKFIADTFYIKEEPEVPNPEVEKPTETKPIETKSIEANEEEKKEEDIGGLIYYHTECIATLGSGPKYYTLDRTIEIGPLQEYRKLI